MTCQSRDCSEEVIHLADDLSFVAEVHIVIGIWDHDDAGARHAAAEIVSPFGTACFVVRDQSGFARAIRQPIPVVRAGIDGEGGNGNASVLCMPKLSTAPIGERDDSGGILATSALLW